MHVDHIKPRSLFPDLALRLENLQVLCSQCNEAKSNIDTTDWRPVGVKVYTDHGKTVHRLPRGQKVS